MAELLSAIEPERADALAKSLFCEFGTLGRIWAQSPEALARVLGADSRAAHLLFAARSAVLAAMHCDLERDRIDPADPSLGRYLMASMGSLADEVLRILFLDARGGMIADEQLQWGSLAEVALHPRTIFRRAMEHNAAGILLVHNHPSGDVAPSAHDIEVTDMLRALGRSLDVTLVDHIIVTARSWQSVRTDSRRGGAPREHRERRLRDSGRALPDLAAIERNAHANARRELQRRRVRRELIGNASFFGEPAWEMLMDLFIHACESKRVATNSLCIASGVPVSTALRLLNRLCDAGIVLRRRDASDARRQFVELSPGMQRKLLAYFAAQSMGTSFGGQAAVEYGDRSMPLGGGASLDDRSA